MVMVMVMDGERGEWGMGGEWGSMWDCVGGGKGSWIEGEERVFWGSDGEGGGVGLLDSWDGSLWLESRDT